MQQAYNLERMQCTLTKVDRKKLLIFLPPHRTLNDQSSAQEHAVQLGASYGIECLSDIGRHLDCIGQALHEKRVCRSRVASFQAAISCMECWAET